MYNTNVWDLKLSVELKIREAKDLEDLKDAVKEALWEIIDAIPTVPDPMEE